MNECRQQMKMQRRTLPLLNRDKTRKVQKQGVLTEMSEMGVGGGRGFFLPMEPRWMEEMGILAKMKEEEEETADKGTIKERGLNERVLGGWA